MLLLGPNKILNSLEAWLQCSLVCVGVGVQDTVAGTKNDAHLQAQRLARAELTLDTLNTHYLPTTHPFTHLSIPLPPPPPNLGFSHKKTNRQTCDSNTCCVTAVERQGEFPYS